MAVIQGTVVKLSYHSGIIRGDDGKAYQFNRKAIVQGVFEEAKAGQRVQFQPDGERAREVQMLADVVEIEKPEPRPPQRQQPGPYRFLNPYNFVRSLEVHDPTSAPLLGRCAPPPHDRYVGLTGRIMCRLTAATPIFISDSYGIELEEVGGKKHQHHQFFHDPEGNVAIPGTSLRGAIRSVFEAVTNSCFASFASDKRLSYHLPPGDALRLVPARVRANGEKWELELMPGTTPVAPNQRPSGPQYATWVHTYRPLWMSQTSAKVPSSPYARRSKLALAGWQHGEACNALVELVQHPLRRFEFWNVVALAKPGGSLPKPTGNQRMVTGYLCVTNQNIENKHDERLFFSTQQLKPLELPADVRKEYEELIADYQERHGDEVRKRKQPTQPHGKEPAFSRFILEHTGKKEPKLVDGDLVYAMLERAPGGLHVQFIVPVSVPRVGFKRAIGELLHPDELKKCEQYDNLCPTCRTFGWVWGGDNAQQPRPGLEEPVAYAGRVRISHARKIHDAGVFNATLAILSAPKPTTTRFYLTPKNGKPQDGLDDERVGYNAAGQVLRGRKIYRHHGSQLSEREFESVDGAKSDQNRTVHGVQNTGTVFEFTLDFENLAEVELGALLWTLELEGWHHRIGLGKPLGFGSATIQIDQIELLNAEARYSDLDAGKGLDDQTTYKPMWIDIFKQAMQVRFGENFEKLLNVRDLRALLAETPALPVHYPRASRNPQPEGKNYEWFVGNKRSGRKAGPRRVLPLADEDTDGFQLINRLGEEGYS